MKVEIIRHIPEAGHYPGQIVMDHPNELQWLNEGRARPVKSERETASIEPQEQAVSKPKTKPKLSKAE